MNNQSNGGPKAEIVEYETGDRKIFNLHITHEDGTVSKIENAFDPDELTLKINIDDFTKEIERAYKKGFQEGYKEVQSNFEENS